MPTRWTAPAAVHQRGKATSSSVRTGTGSPCGSRRRHQPVGRRALPGDPALGQRLRWATHNPSGDCASSGHTLTWQRPKLRNGPVRSPTPRAEAGRTGTT